MRTNKISAVLAQANADAAILKIKDAETLLPFLVNASVEERKRTRKMGPKSAEFVQECRVGANQYTNNLAADFPVAEFGKDTDLYRTLFPVFVAARAFTEALSDTMLLLGGDCMAQADEVYESLKSAAKKDANVKALVDQLSMRYKAQGKRQPKKP